MQCLSCGTELLHAANFCPVCGARLAAPTPDGSAATLIGDAQPSVIHLDDSRGGDANVRYLPGAEDGRTVPANPHAADYAPGITPAAPLPAAPVTSLHASTPETPEPRSTPVPARDPDNPFGNFFDDGPSAWLEDEDEDEFAGQPRIVGSMLAACSICMLLVAWAVWGRAMYIGSGGAEAGGFVLLSMLLWIWYISLPREQQHRRLLQRHDAIAAFIDRRATPLRTRTEGQFAVRRERDRYRAMRDERTRRVTALGEASYRTFRSGQLPPELHSSAQKVLAMEQQMLLQDHRLEQLARPPASSDADGADAAPDEPDGGHSPAS